MYSRLLVLFVLSMPLFLCAQISGNVYDENQQPIGEVDVFISDFNLLTQTDEKGFFQIEQDISLDAFIQFSKYGYANKVVRCIDNQDFTVVLKSLHVELDEIGIQEKKSILGNNEAINIEHKSLQGNFISSTSLVDNISQLPGLNSIGSGLGIQKIVIRGLSGLRVVTYLNGMRISNQEWANDHGIGFTDLGLYNVELIKGASSLKYGSDAVGGVIYFNDEPFIESVIPSGFVATKFDNGHTLFSNQFGVKLSRNNLYFNMYGEDSFSSDYRLPDNTYLFNSRFRNRAFKLSAARLGGKMQSIFRYQYNRDQLGIPAHVHGGDLTAISLESITLNSLDFSTDFDLTRPTQYINNHLIIFENKYFSNKVKYNFFAGYFINNLQEYDKWTVPAFDMDLSTTTLRLSADFALSSFDVSSGLQVQRQKNYNNIVSRLIPDSESNDISFYTTIDFDQNNFGFNSGVRLDYKQINCDDFNYSKLFSSLNSSIGLFYKKNAHLARITYSSSYRSPHLSELFSNGLHHGTMRYEVGNINLDIEKSYQFDLKYQWFNDHIGFVINPFIQLVNNFITINPTDSLHQSIYRIYEYEQYNKIEMSGCEMNLHYHPHFLHNLHVEQSYSFVHAINRDNDAYLPLTPANKIKTRINLDLTDYNLLFRLRQISVYHLYSFSQENVALYESSTNSYNVINMELLLNPAEDLSCNLSVNNLLNEEYVPHLSRIKEVSGGVPHPGRSFRISLKYDF